MRRRLNLLVGACLAISGCVLLPREPGIGQPVSWSKLSHWEQDRHAESWPALLSGCRQLRRQPDWSPICQAADTLSAPTDDQARRFYENWFRPHTVYGNNGRRKGLITGYYEPSLQGSLTPSDRYRYPLYRRPGDLLTIDLTDLYPELAGKRLRGKLQGQKIVPYYSREELDKDPGLLTGHELLWLDDPIASFFLHIQGSGRVKLADGTWVSVGYADQNGHPYRSIGRELIELGELTRQEVTMFTIRDWLRTNPQHAHDLLHRNPSYVFFVLRDSTEYGPLGSLNVPLTPERSLAVDAGVIPLGAPLWIETTLPDARRPGYHRLVLAQDTGGAIRGPVRVDLFWGRGKRAERMAGTMKQDGRIYVLLPKRAHTGQSLNAGKQPARYQQAN